MLEKCISMIKNEGFTVVLSDGTRMLTGTERGVKPLLNFLDEYGTLKGFFAADRVVGTAAAFIYVKLGIRRVFAITISDGACKVFDSYGVDYTYENRVPVIRNRSNTDSCPMEKATADAGSPEQAIALIRQTLKALSEK